MNRGDPEWVNGEIIAYAWLVDYRGAFLLFAERDDRATSPSAASDSVMLSRARQGITTNSRHAPDFMDELCMR